MNSGARAEQRQEAGPPIQVRCARDLFQALESRRWRHPPRSASSRTEGSGNGPNLWTPSKRDLVDVLISQAQRFRGDLEWLSWIGALATFRDLRVVRSFASLITTESHAELLFALAHYLRHEPSDSIRYSTRPGSDAEPIGRTGAGLASILATCPAFRQTKHCASAAGARKRVPLPVFPAAPENGLYELAGPFQSEARLALQRQGPSTLATVVGRWDQLSESTKKWLLEWGVETNADLILDPIREVLVARSDALILPALEAVPRLKHSPAHLDELIIPFLDDDEELVRRAAILAIRSALNWQLIFENDRSVLVRQTCISKVMDQGGSEAVSFAMQQLANPDWRIRAAAAEALLSLGEFGVRAAFELMPQASEPVRIGIARMVIHCADEDLLNEFIQCCSQPVSTQSANAGSQPHPQCGASQQSRDMATE